MGGQVWIAVFMFNIPSAGDGGRARPAAREGRRLTSINSEDRRLHDHNLVYSGSNHSFGCCAPGIVSQAMVCYGQLIHLADAADRVRLSLKMRTVEAVIQPNGDVLLVEPVHLASPRRALVTIMEEAPHPHDVALLSEAALGEDWNRPEEDAAWAHLQPGKSS